MFCFSALDIYIVASTFDKQSKKATYYLLDKDAKQADEVINQQGRKP